MNKSKALDTFTNARVICAILAVVVALVVLISVRQLRQQAATEQKQTVKTVPSFSGNKENKLPRNQQTPPDDTVKKLVQAWNRGNLEQIADMFASDGLLIMPAGSQIQSRAAIRRTIAEQRAGVLKDTRLRNSVEDVSQPDAERAIIKGTYQLEGISVLGVSSATSGSYVLQQIKRDGRWLISKAEVTSGNSG